MKTAIIATILTIALILACSFVIPASAEWAPVQTVVLGSEREGELWIVSCLAEDGNIWAFLDDEGDWDVGDLCVLMMDGDEVVDVYWNGYLDPNWLTLFCHGLEG